MVLDIFFAAGLVYLSSGSTALLPRAVSGSDHQRGSVRRHRERCVGCDHRVIYLFVGGTFTPSDFVVDPNATIGKVFLFVVVALATGYMTRVVRASPHLSSGPARAPSSPRLVDAVAVRMAP